jgi:autotransporter-associated beta strand protein
MGGACQAGGATRRYFRTARAVLLGSSALCLASALPAAAQDATWRANPGSGDFNTGANWDTGVVPTGTAFFDTSGRTALSFSTSATVGGWTFNAGPSNYSFSNTQSLSFTGAGIDIQGGSAAITNNSGGSLTFNNTSTAGSAAITNTSGSTSFNGGRLIFNNTSTAGSATITNRNGPVIFNDASTAGSATILTTDGGFNRVFFENTSTAGSASITANNAAEVHFNATSTAGSATITTTNGGSLIFDNTSTAGNAAITNNSGSVIFGATSTAGNATITNNRDLYFFATSTAGSATITTNSGGRSQIANSASGGTARFILNGTGALDILFRTTGATAGSIEGAGSVFLGSNNLAVGGNNLSTTFSGVIQDGGFAAGTGGSLTKTGSGTLTLSGANTYTGGTTINAGMLAISADNNLGANTGGLTFNGGTLQFGASFDLANSRTITLNAGGGTFDTNGFNTMVSQAMGGTGALVKAGSGMLTLSGINTYGGGTTISAGALQIGNGGTTGSVLGNITNNAALVFNRLDAVTFGGVISGSGTLEKLGLGTLTLSGINTYTGATTVNGGTLRISGSIASSTVTNNATLAYIGNATAGSASITNNNNLQFNGASSAGNASITSKAGLDFRGTSTAGSASIANSNGMSFGDTSTAGNATISNSHTLQFNDTSTAGSATITSTDTLAFRSTSTAGSARIANSGGMIFSDTATAGSAGITNDGTMNFSGTATAGSAGITNNGSMVFFDTATTGSAMITNAGTMTFAFNSTAGSATIANNNFLQFVHHSTAGSAAITNGASGNTDFSQSDGPLRDRKLSAGSINGGGVFKLGRNELTVGGNNLSTNVTGVIVNGGVGGGTGASLIKTGAGTMILSGTNTYTGATTVNGGTLAVNGSILASNRVTVNAGGTLAGTGTVHNAFIGGGTLMAGNGTAGSSMTVNGTLGFNAAATYRVNVDPTMASFANVSGAATLGGATVNASFAPGSYISKQYTILTAGSISGTFGTLANTNLPANFHDSLSYDATHAYLNLDLNFSTPAANTLNGNQNNVANALINFFDTTGGIPMVFAALNANGLSQASGEAATGSQQTTFGAMNQFMGVMTDPFIAGRGDGLSAGEGGATGFADEGFGVSAYASPDTPRSKRERDAYAAIYRKAPPPLVDTFNQRWSVWAAGYGGSQTTDGNATQGSNTTTSGIYGTAVGADYRFSPNTLAGFALAGGGTGFSVVNAGSGRSDLFQAGAFIRHNAGPAYITAALAYGWQDVTTDRTVTIAGTDRLRARFNASAFSGRAEAGYRLVSPWIGGVGITPYAAGQFTTFELPAYAEQVVSGANTFALAYSSKSVTATRSELGFRTDKSFAMQSAILTLRGRAAWAHDFNPDRAIGATFQTLPGASFVVNGARQASDAALTTASAEIKWMNGWSATGTFEGEFSSVTRSYAGKGVVRYSW